MKKKMTKAVSLLLTVVLVFSVFAIVPMTTVSAAGGIQAKINQLKSVYGDGTYFTVNGGPCYNSGGSNCYLPSIPSRGGLPAGSVCGARGYSCWGFAHYAFHFIFGSLPESNAKTYSPSYGDYVCVNLGYGEHYGILVGSDNSNYYIYDCNGDWTYVSSLGYSTSTCKMITSHRCAKSTFRYAYHANNYGQVDGVPPVTYSASTGGSSNVSNTNATISGSANASNGSAPRVSSWGYYIGTNSNPRDKKTAGWPNGNVSSLSCNVKDHCGNLSPGTTYYYKIWAVINGREYSGGVNSFRTTAIKPSASTIKTSTADIGLGVNPVVTWNGASYADSYTLQLKNSSGDVVQSKAGITGTTYSFTGLNTAGTYTATIYSVNAVGSTQGNSVNITVHPNSTVRFIDVNPETNEEVVVKEQSVVYGQNATAPANPSKTGYTFKRWNGTYTNVKADTNITSVYEINTYTVKFVNSYTGELLKTESVKYKHSATPPEYELPRGYVNVESGWDKDYTKVLDDTTYYSVIEWGNPDIPMYIKGVSVKRYTDLETYKNEGYEVTVNLKNWDTSLTTGRLIIALMTNDGQLLTETESAAFYLKTSAEKSVEVFVPYKDAIDYVRVFVVDQYSTATPISEPEICDDIITVGNSYVYSYGQAPKQGTYEPDSLTTYTEYRYKTKDTAVSYDTSMAGWKNEGFQLIQTGSGTIQYVPSWPWGFDTNHYLYGKYNKSPVSAYENSTSKRTVNTTDGNYIYWHWSYPLSGYHAEANREMSSRNGEWISGCGYTTIFEAVESSSRFDFWGGNYNVFRREGLSSYTYWWTAGMDYGNVDLRVKNCNYTDYRKLYTYSKESAWSTWSTTPKTSNSNTTVEKRTVYKYIPLNRTNNTLYVQLNNAFLTDNSSYYNPNKLWAYTYQDNNEANGEYISLSSKGDSGYYELTIDKGTNVIFCASPCNTSDEFYSDFYDDMEQLHHVNSNYDNAHVRAKTEPIKFDGKNNLCIITDIKEYFTPCYDEDFRGDVSELAIWSVEIQKNQSDVEIDENSLTNISGKIGEEFAGKQAALFIYKVDSASDYTNEYIGQTVIGEDGSYEFKFKLRENPTVETGDFTVVLNLEGATAPIYLDPIKAPKKEYTVKFYDYDYSRYNPDNPDSKPELTVISEQTVEEGKSAVLPNDKLIGREGYTFAN